MSLTVALAGATIAVLLVANAGADKDVCTVAISMKTAGCFLRNYKELAAALIGAGAVVFCAWLTWTPADRKIPRSPGPEGEARELIVARLETQILPTVNEVWRALERAMVSGVPDEVKKDRETAARIAVQHFPRPEIIDNIEQLSTRLSLRDREKLVNVAVGLRLFLKNRGDGEGVPLFYCFRLCGTLSQLAGHVEAFEPKLAAFFADRQRVGDIEAPNADALFLAELNEKVDQGYLRDP